MKILLRLKAWQLFMLSALPLMFSFSGIVFQVIYLFGLLVYVGWIFSIGYFMHSFIQLKSKPKIVYFKVSCPLMILVPLIAYDIPSSNTNECLYWILSTIAVITWLYSFGFAAMMLESVINGEMVNRSDSLKTFLYIWFFPIGIWYLQPAIKQVLAKQESPLPRV